VFERSDARKVINKFAFRRNKAIKILSTTCLGRRAKAKAEAKRRVCQLFSARANIKQTASESMANDCVK